MDQIYNLLRHEIIDYSPDLIIVYSAYNDAFMPPLVRRNNIFHKLHNMLYYRWMLYTVLLEKYSAMRHKTPLPYFYIKKDIPGGYYKNLKLILKLARDKDFEIIFVKQPSCLSFEGVSRRDSIYKLEEKYKQTTDEEKRCIIRDYYFTHQMEELAEENNFLLIDPLPILEGRNDFFLDEVHLNSNGARVLAELVAKEILKNR